MMSRYYILAAIYAAISTVIYEFGARAFDSGSLVIVLLLVLLLMPYLLVGWILRAIHLPNYIIDNWLFIFFVQFIFAVLILTSLRSFMAWWRRE